MPNPTDASPPLGSMTGLSRGAVAGVGLVIGLVAVFIAIACSGAFSWCGFDENQAPGGYCGVSSFLRAALIAIPAITVLVGYVASVTRVRLTPIALASFIAVSEGLIALALLG